MGNESGRKGNIGKLAPTDGTGRAGYAPGVMSIYMSGKGRGGGTFLGG